MRTTCAFNDQLGSGEGAQLEHWTELRTAWFVAKLGTVSAAAAALGVHRATVTRRVDSLEASFGAPLFLRNARGYMPTEAGQAMLEVARRADEMFTELERRTRGGTGQLPGELVVTALPGVAPLVMPAIARFRSDHPHTTIEYIAGAELARLEYGEAHVALRAGPKPEDLDYVVLPYTHIRFGLYAHKRYATRYGLPDDRDDLRAHRFVGSVDHALPYPYADWLAAHVSGAALALRTGHPLVVMQGIMAGLGLGFLPQYEASACPNLIEVMPSRDEWKTALWIVTHADLHRTAKVQEFLRCLRETATR